MTSNAETVAGPPGQDVLIIGSGLAAYGACLALLEQQEYDIVVIDIGLKKAYPGQPNLEVPNAIRADHQYFSYGINDKRWPIALKSRRLCSSHAIGGYSKVYSGSILAPQDEDLLGWPSLSRPSPSHYNAILSSLRICQTEDELSEAFPIMMGRRNQPIKGNVYAGAPRIALNKKGKLDMPFDCSYEFEMWASTGQIRYLPNRYVTHVESGHGEVLVHMQTETGKETRRCRKVLIGSGCINTTAIVDRSIYREGQRRYTIHATVLLLQLYLRIRRLTLFSQSLRNPDLCKVFLEHRSRSTDWTWSHSQFNALNRTIKDTIHQKLPSLATFLVDLLDIAVVFSISCFHSRLGPCSHLICRVTTDDSGDLHQEIEIEEIESRCDRRLRTSLHNAVLKTLPRLGLLPLPWGSWIADRMRGNRLGGWHYGGTLPMVSNPQKPSQCHPNGEVAGLKDVFVIDAASFPSVPASTVALLTMANAYRIAKTSIHSKVQPSCL